MARRGGSADLPLHGGTVPRWLADRMTRLGAVVAEAIVHHYGRDELLREAVGWEMDRFIGLAGLNDVRFRGMVVPPARIYFVAGDVRLSGRRLARMPAQAFCNGTMTLDLELLGAML